MLSKQNRPTNKWTKEQILKLKLTLESKHRTEDEISEVLKDFGIEGHDSIDLLFELLERLDQNMNLNPKSKYHKKN